MINKKQAYKTLLKSWFFTILGFISVIGLFILISIVLRKYGAYRIIFSSFLILGIINLIVFFFNELLVVKLYNGIRIEQNEQYKILIENIRKLCKGRLLLRVPRIYLLEMNSPNACAFGWGFFGQYAMGFSPEIIKKLSEKELTAVAAHELAHIMHLDVGINTALSFSSNYATILAFRVMKFGGILTGPLGWTIALGLWLIGRIIKFLFYLISQEREIAADTLGCLYVNNSVDLAEALKKISSGKKSFNKEESYFKDIMISHPHMDERSESLKQLESFNIN